MPVSNHIRATQAATDEEALIGAHLAAIAWIEDQLLERMTVKSIADLDSHSLQGSVACETY